MTNFFLSKSTAIGLYNILSQKLFLVAKLAFFLANYFVKNKNGRVIFSRDDEFFVYSKRDNIKMYLAYPGRSLAYLKGVKAHLLAYKNRYPIPEINFEKPLTIIDCGGNIGEFSFSWMLNHSNSSIYVFEPSPLEFSILTRNLSGYSDKITYINKALGNQTGEISFYVKSKDADSSTIAPKTYEKKIQIPVITLNDFFREKKVKKIDFLKLEAEGAEPEVLLGAIDVLKKTRYISVDWGPERGVSEETTLATVCNILFPLGFEMHTMQEVNYTCLFKNKNL
jgi:FkbM family methyltransferase